MQRFTIQDFNGFFPDDNACLEWLKNHLYPEGIFCDTCKSEVDPKIRTGG